MAIAIGSVGTLGKLCSEIIEGIDRGPIEAADSVGATQLQRLRWAVVPQTMPEIASFVLYRFEINIRVSSMLGVLGVGGIGQILSEGLRFKEWGLAGMALIVVVVTTILIDTLSGAVRRRIVAGPSGLTIVARRAGDRRRAPRLTHPMFGAIRVPRVRHGRHVTLGSGRLSLRRGR